MILAIPRAHAASGTLVSMRRILPILLIVACSDREASKPGEPAAKSRPEQPQAPRAPSRDRPELPAAPESGSDDKPVAASTAIADAFAAEPVDTAWKSGTERDIHARVPAAGDVECHRTLCRITITGSEKELTAAIDAMEQQASLRGIASNVLLTAPEHQHDGKLALRAYARFDRPE
jgi:hypothetical protein